MGTIEFTNGDLVEFDIVKSDVRTRSRLRRIAPTWRQWLMGATAEYVVEQWIEFSWIAKSKETHDED